MATYNCSDSASNAYGTGSYGHCETSTVGAPNTGVFQEIISGGSFTILAPLVVAVVLAVVATIVVGRRKKAKA